MRLLLNRKDLKDQFKNVPAGEMYVDIESFKPYVQVLIERIGRAEFNWDIHSETIDIDVPEERED